MAVDTKAYYFHRILSILLVFVAASPKAQVNARTWRDIQTHHIISPEDVINKIHRLEVHPSSYYTDLTQSPNQSPPQQHPAAYPDLERPPPPPVGSPISMPTLQTVTEAPIVGVEEDEDFYPENPIPLNPPIGYFNYDLREENPYGPGVPDFFHDANGQFAVQYRNNGWANVQMPNDFYWSEFGPNGSGPWIDVLTDRNMNENQCGNLDGQSPIDIRLSGVACVEHHQIRSRSGDFRVTGAGVTRQIESNKLRLKFQRRPCADLFDAVCSEPDPPAADFPNGWGGFADTLHVDFKFPAEHRIYGETFDGEMQIFHLHPGRERLPAISVLIKAVPNGYNEYLQAAIDAFQFEYDVHRSQCADSIRKGRRMVSDFQSDLMGQVSQNEMKELPTTSSWFDHHKHWAEFSTDLDDPKFIKKGENLRRKMQSGRWNPYHEALIPTYWFYGYDGSLTEPPCSEIVSWFVMDEPMIISPEQLEQMKGILFTHVDENCQSTSVHFRESVARPIQESAGRQIWRCTRDDFVPDSQRGDN